ncbi:MAG: hypothetical protein BWK79_06315 [Beggiatoa sp. IS2]|nr:MAG: hypothetical protein BWK79_06315 [Beggiatoa sp. IS2]
MLLFKYTFYLLGSVILIFTVSCARVVSHTGCWVADPYINGQYSGQCNNNKAYGMGRSVGIDTYEGEFVDGAVHGHGTYIWADGDRYVGNFQGGKPHGRGTMIHRDGTRESGSWEYGKLTQPDNKWINQVLHFSTLLETFLTAAVLLHLRRPLINTVTTR